MVSRLNKSYRFVFLLTLTVFMFSGQEVQGMRRLGEWMGVVRPPPPPAAVPAVPPPPPAAAVPPPPPAAPAAPAEVPLTQQQTDAIAFVVGAQNWQALEAVRAILAAVPDNAANHGRQDAEAKLLDVNRAMAVITDAADRLLARDVATISLAELRDAVAPLTLAHGYVGAYAKLLEVATEMAARDAAIALNLAAATEQQLRDAVPVLARSAGLHDADAPAKLQEVQAVVAALDLDVQNTTLVALQAASLLLVNLHNDAVCNAKIGVINPEVAERDRAIALADPVVVDLPALEAAAVVLARSAGFPDARAADKLVEVKKEIAIKKVLALNLAAIDVPVLNAAIATLTGVAGGRADADGIRRRGAELVILLGRKAEEAQASVGAKELERQAAVEAKAVEVRAKDELTRQKVVLEGEKERLVQAVRDEAAAAAKAREKADRESAKRKALADKRKAEAVARLDHWKELDEMRKSLIKKEEEGPLDAKSRAGRKQALQEFNLATSTELKKLGLSSLEEAIKLGKTAVATQKEVTFGLAGQTESARVEARRAVLNAKLKHPVAVAAELLAVDNAWLSDAYSKASAFYGAMPIAVPPVTVPDGPAKLREVSDLLTAAARTRSEIKEAGMLVSEWAHELNVAAPAVRKVLFNAPAKTIEGKGGEAPKNISLVDDSTHLLTAAVTIDGKPYAEGNSALLLQSMFYRIVLRARRIEGVRPVGGLYTDSVAMRRNDATIKKSKAALTDESERLKRELVAKSDEIRTTVASAARSATAGKALRKEIEELTSKVEGLKAERKEAPAKRLEKIADLDETGLTDLRDAIAARLSSSSAAAAGGPSTGDAAASATVVVYGSTEALEHVQGFSSVNIEALRQAFDGISDSTIQGARFMTFMKHSALAARCVAIADGPAPLVSAAVLISFGNIDGRAPIWTSGLCRGVVPNLTVNFDAGGAHAELAYQDKMYVKIVVQPGSAATDAVGLEKQMDMIAALMGVNKEFKDITDDDIKAVFDMSGQMADKPSVAKAVEEVS